MSKLNNRKFANLIADQVRTLGGYIYGGTQVTGTVPGLSQEQWSCTGENYWPSQADRDQNRRRLAAAPVGAQVGFSSTVEGCQTEETWTKVGPCAWEKTEDTEERWGDWGESHEDRISPEWNWASYREDEAA